MPIIEHKASQLLRNTETLSEHMEEEKESDKYFPPQFPRHEREVPLS